MKNFDKLMRYSFNAKKTWSVGNNFLRYTLPYFIILAMTIGSNNMFYEYFFIIYAVCSVSVGMYITSKSSVFYTAPVSYKRRTFYYFAEIIYFSLLTIVIIIALIIILAIIAAIIALATNGLEQIVTEGTQEIASKTLKYSTNAILYSVFRTIFMCSVTAAICHIKDTKKYLISLVVAAAIIIIGHLYINHLAGTSIIIYSDTTTELAKQSLYYNFEKLPNPTLATVLCGVFALISVIGSITFVLLREKPKKY